MDATEVDSILTDVERALAEGAHPDLRGLGFWRAVAAAKRDPKVRDRFADRIAGLDRAAFERGVLFHMSAVAGTRLMLAATAIGIGVIGAGYYASEPWNGFLLLAGTGVLLVTTHGLGHLAVGMRAGIRFTHWFIGTLLRPQPGVKTDYATYLRVPAAARARMHAAGAVVTKLVPFVMLGAAWGMDAPTWAWLLLLAIGVGASITDALWSTKSSDWKRYRRERRLADQGF